MELDRRLHDISALKMGHRDRVGFLLALSQELQQLAASMRFSRAMTWLRIARNAGLAERNHHRTRLRFPRKRFTLLALFFFNKYGRLWFFAFHWCFEWHRSDRRNVSLTRKRFLAYFLLFYLWNSLVNFWLYFLLKLFLLDCYQLLYRLNLWFLLFLWFYSCCIFFILFQILRTSCVALNHFEIFKYTEWFLLSETLARIWVTWQTSLFDLRTRLIKFGTNSSFLFVSLKNNVVGIPYFAMKTLSVLFKFLHEA